MLKSNFWKNSLFFLLLLVTVGNFFYHAYSYRNDIFKKFDFQYWTYRYMHSQWFPTKMCLVTDPHINPHTCMWDDSWYAQHPKILPQYQKISIGDDGLYMYAGAAYLKGQDPSLLNAELPPLGKYIVGVFELATGYEGAFSLFFGMASIVLVFFLSRELLKSSLLAILVTCIFSFEPLFITQMRAAYLDTLYLTCLLASMLSFARKNYFLAGIFAGAFMAVKSPFLVVLLLGTYAIIWLVQKEFSLKKVTILLGSTFAVYLLSYIQVFFYHPSLSYFIGVQKYIIHFYLTGAKGVIGAVFPMLFLGKWYTWFSPVQRVAEWTIFWPVITMFSLVGGILALKQRQTTLLLLFVWVILYFLFLMITPVFARYLLLAIPFLYNLSIWSLSAVIKSRFS